MKKVLFLCLFAGIGLSLQAQDPVKDIKKAARLLGTYNLDPTLSADKLVEAVSLANASMDDPLVKSDPAAWQTYGDIFMTIVNNDVAHFVIDPDAKVADPSASGKAFKGFKMAAELADKSYQTKDAMKALSNGIQNIYYMGSALYQTDNFKEAYEAFKATYDGYALLKKNNEPTTFEPGEKDKALYYSGLCAQQAGMMNEAKAVYKQLVDEGIAEPGVYESLIKIYEKEDPALSEKYLIAAREKYPDDTQLLFTEINYLISKGQLESLVSRLEIAAQKDPKNPSIPVTQGQVYDSQFQKAQDAFKSYTDSIAVFNKRLVSAKNKIEIQDSIKVYQERIQVGDAKAESDFTKAMSYYKNALEIDPSNFEALYSTGALWYNKAARFSVELNLLSSDYTAAGTKKYDAKKAQMDETFQKSLPFFLRAEFVKPDDLNTLIALKEIYARQDKFELVEEYKIKIEKISSGSTNVSDADNSQSDKGQVVIQMKKSPGGTYEVPCRVNGLELKFIFDTGASDVSISLAEALFMLKNDYLTEDDILGTEYYSIANGDIVEGTKIRIRELKFGGVILYNIEASIVHTLGAPLLLGQSAISKLGKIQLDPSNGTLTIIK